MDTGLCEGERIMIDPIKRLIALIVGALWVASDNDEYNDDDDDGSVEFHKLRKYNLKGTSYETNHLHLP